MRAAVELAKDWRTDRMLQKTRSAVSCCRCKLFLNHYRQWRCHSAGAGSNCHRQSGGPFAQAAAKALLDNTELPVHATIVEKALTIAGDICIYTNQHHTIEDL